jgi:hypothetical protein
MIPIGPATLPTCRAGQPQTVLPADDSLICTPTSTIASNHLLAAVAAQNYGQNSYRIRQPFDFAGRTGRIVFDTDTAMHTLLGWISLAVTEDPAPIPGYSIGGQGQNNDEGGSSPRRGFIVVFQACNQNFDQYAVRLIDVFEGHRDSLHTPSSMNCLAAKEGSLSHIEVRVSQQRIEVYGTPDSANGTSFATPTLIYGADVSLPFSRGYVHLTVHNHASHKYSNRDAWFGRFDNLGFDGPVVNNFREYELPDALVSGTSSSGTPLVNLGYRVRDAADGPQQTLAFNNVSLTDVTAARLSFASWYLIIAEPEANFANYKLKFRFNGGPWRERAFTAEELALLKNTRQWGQLGQIADVPLSDLVEGRNTLEFVTQGVPQGYPPAVWSIDLVLTTR